MKHLRPIILILITIGALTALSERAWCDPTGVVSRVRAEYLRLRNVDPSGTDSTHVREWESLGAKMRSLLTTRVSDSELPRLRLLTGDTHLRLFRSTKQRGYLTVARDSVAPFVSSGEQIDRDLALRAEGFILMGDIILSGGGMADAAEPWYERAREVGGVTGSVALQRMQGLRNKTFSTYVPSRDLEVPRLIRNRPPTSRAGKRRIVVLDAGHGGGDAGAIGLGGAQEKEITIDIVRRVKAILEKRYGYVVSLTRKGDTFVPLARRTAFANRKNAAAFISLHVNASAGHDGSGFEAYYLDNTNDEASRKLAERENGVEAGNSVDDLSFMLSDLIQSGKLEDSILLTRSIEGSVRGKVISNNPGLRSLGVKKAPFFVLVGAHMPCSLIEMFFVDHPVDGSKLQKEQFRSALAVGIADGIRIFVEKSGV